MTEGEMFAYGFLLRCADEGLDPAGVERRKQAALTVAARRSKSASFLSTAALATPLALAVPPVLAYAAGAGSAHLRDQMRNDVKLDRQSMQQEETLQELERQMAMLRDVASRHRVGKLRNPRRSTVSPPALRGPAA